MATAYSLHGNDFNLMKVKGEQSYTDIILMFDLKWGYLSATNALRLTKQASSLPNNNNSKQADMAFVTGNFYFSLLD